MVSKHTNAESCSSMHKDAEISDNIYICIWWILQVCLVKWSSLQDDQSSNWKALCMVKTSHPCMTSTSKAHESVSNLYNSWYFQETWPQKLVFHCAIILLRSLVLCLHFARLKSGSIITVDIKIWEMASFDAKSSFGMI